MLHLSDRPPPIEPPSIVDMILHRRYVPKSRNYFCSGHEHLGSPVNVGVEHAAFILPSNKPFERSEYLQKTEKQNTDEERRKFEGKIINNYQVSRSSDILRRLHVDNKLDIDETKDTEIGKEVFAITDIDPQYFTELSGQVIDDKFSLRQLVNDTKDILRTNILILFHKNECHRIDDLIDEEIERLEKTEKDFKLVKIGFDKFLEETHKETIAVKNNLESELSKTKELEEKLTQLTDESERLRRAIHNLGKPWKQQKLCQHFLFKMSPESWRTENNINNYAKPEEEVFSSNVNEAQFEDNLLNDISESIKNAEASILYFREPLELIRTFNAIEMQQLNALTHQDLLSEMIEQMLKFVNKTQKEVDNEIQSIEKDIEYLEVDIVGKTKYASDLEYYANDVLHDVFDSLINSKSVLHLQALLEGAYESCVGPINEDLTILAMMKAVEQTYEHLSSQLDKFPKDIVAVCRLNYRQNRRKQLRKEAEAEKENKRIARLMQVLKRIMEPPKKPKRRLVWRSLPPAIKIKKARPPQPLTEEEILYLDLFTECSKYDITVKDRRLLPTELMQKMKDFSSNLSSLKDDIDEYLTF